MLHLSIKCRNERVYVSFERWYELGVFNEVLGESGNGWMMCWFVGVICLAYGIIFWVHEL